MTTSPPVVHIIVDLNDGGAEAALYRLCTARGFDRHHVISLMGPGKYGPLLNASGIPVTCIGMVRGRLTPSALWHLWRHLRALRPTAVQTWMYHADLIGGVASRLAGIRNVNWGIHNSLLVPGQNKAATIAVARICARLSTVIPRTIICCAHQIVEPHARLGYSRAAMRVIPNGYDLDQFHPSAEQRAAIRAELNLDQAEVIGFVARYDPAKDHDNLLAAMTILRQRGSRPWCLLVGTGMEKGNKNLAEAIERHGLADRVVLLGRRSDVPAIMNALDLHVLSSSAEAFPNVLAEAMACGTPCVTTDVGDAADIVGDGGWVVPPADANALASAIEAALVARRSPHWAKRQAVVRERIAQSFSIERMSTSYQNIWHRCDREGVLDAA